MSYWTLKTEEFKSEIFKISSSTLINSLLLKALLFSPVFVNVNTYKLCHASK